MIPRIVLFLLLLTLVNCTFRKCCDSDEGLLKNINSTKYNCSSNFTEYVLPLGHNNNNNLKNELVFGMSDSCKDTCIDKVVEGTDVIKLSCDYEKMSSVKIPTIYKCCPLNMVYNITLKSCINDTRDNTIFDSSATVYNFVIGIPSCSWAVVDYTYEDNFEINNGTLDIFRYTSKHNTKSIKKTFENGSYCVDRSTQQNKIHIRSCDHISLCKTEISCVPKCCPVGFKLYKSRPKEKSSCVPEYSVPFFKNFINSTGDVIGIPEKLGIINRRQCANYVAPPGSSIFDNGTFKMDNYFFHGIEQDYCVDFYQGPSNHMYIGLVCYPDKEWDQILPKFVYLTGLIISIISLCITITIYFFLPELQNLHGRTLMSHSTSLLASYIFLAFVTTPTTNYDKTTCNILSYGILYSFLVAFAWLNVLCFDIWFTFGVVKVRGMYKKTELKKFLLYSLYAYGYPLIYTGITLYIHLFSNVDKKFKPTFGDSGCWFSFKTKSSNWPHIIFFTMPVGISIIINIVFFTLTVKHCLKVRIDIQRMQHADSPNKRRFFTDKATLIMNLKLFIIMGMGWIIEIISMYQSEPIWLWYILDPINVLQGLWIFFIFVLKENVWKALKKKMGCREVREASQTQSTALSAKLSVSSVTSIRINGIPKPEERELLQTTLRNSSKIPEGPQSTKI